MTQIFAFSRIIREIRCGEEEVDEVDFVGLLFGGGMVFQDVADSGVNLVSAVGLVGELTVVKIVLHRGIGTGKERDLMPSQRFQQVEHHKGGVGHPQHLGV